MKRIRRTQRWAIAGVVVGAIILSAFLLPVTIAQEEGITITASEDRIYSPLQVPNPPGQCYEYSIEDGVVIISTYACP